VSEFHRLVEQQIPRLRRYARALTRNGERGDDLVQDTLVRALAKEHLWQPGTNLRAWLFTIMHNQNVNLVRSSLREGGAVSLDELSGTLEATTADPIVRRQLRELEAALDHLPDEQRQVILLIGLEGMNYAEAATIVNVPIGTIRSRLSRARESLRQMMGVSEKRHLAEAIDSRPAAA
jgi:RNA polymerase sigma-70 factor (ECF subfamily)